VSLPAVPHPPAPPSSEGGEPQPAEEEGTSHGAGRTAQGSPVGDDALPAELEAALCTALSEVLGPLPAQVKGLPASVVDELPAEVTDLVPADVLTTVTLRCPAAETHDPPATAPTEVRSVTTKRTAKAPARPASAPREQARAGFGSLPHTGLVAGIPLAGAALLLTGLALRRTGRAGAQGR
jgi:hypothetical protein